METLTYLIVEDNIITNIIVLASHEDAAAFNALPYYEGADIGDKYNPPVDPTLQDDLASLLIDQEYRLVLLELGLGGSE